MAAAAATTHWIEALIPRDGLHTLSLQDDAQGRPAVKGPVPAHATNLMVGDIVLAVDGSPVFSTTEILSELRRSGATGHQQTADSCRIRVLRLTQQLQPTAWSTKAMTLAAGQKIDVPLMIEEPSLGEYSFRCASGSGSVDFSLDFWRDGQGKDKAADQLVPSPGVCAVGQGSFRVPSAGIVFARLDNTAAFFSSATLSVDVKLTPVSQVLAAEAAEADEATREQIRHCEMLAANESGLEAQEMEMIRSLHALRATRLAAAKVREEDEVLIEQLEGARAKLEAASQVLAAGGADPCGAALDAVDESRQAGAAALQARRSLNTRTTAAESEMAQLIEAEFARERAALDEQQEEDSDAEEEEAQ